MKHTRFVNNFAALLKPQAMAFAILSIPFILLCYGIFRLLKAFRKDFFWYAFLYTVVTFLYGLLPLAVHDLLDSMSWHDEAVDTLKFGLIFFYFVTLPVIFLALLITTVSVVKQMYRKLG